MADLRGFDANDVEPRKAFEPLPADKYQVVIVASEMKDTKACDGQYLELELEVIDGQYKGRKLWDRLTLHHPNQQTVQIAQATLSAICRACGVMQPRDSAELHDLPMVAKVRVKRRKDTGELTNDVAGYERKEAAAAAAAAPQAERNEAPWRR